MTLLIVNHYTHDKTFTVVGEPNGAVKKLEEKGFRLNPQVHADLPPYFFPSRSDGSNETSEEISHPGLSVLEEESSDTSEDTGGKE